jgi:hypothetical protein
MDMLRPRARQLGWHHLSGSLGEFIRKVENHLDHFICIFRALRFAGGRRFRKAAEPSFRAEPCTNRCRTLQASIRSWLTSTTTSSVVISQPPLGCRFSARKIDKQGLVRGFEESISKGCRERRDGSDYPMKA